MALTGAKDERPGWRDFAVRFIPRHASPVWMVFILIVVSIVSAAILVFLPFKAQMAMIMAFPAAIGAIYILLNPVMGVFTFYFIEFFRPQSFIPALRPLKPGLMSVLITIIAFIIHIAITKKRIIWDNINWPYIGFIIIVGSGTFTAMNSRWAYNIFEVMIIGFLVYFVALNLLDTHKRLSILIWMLLLIHAYFAVKGIPSGGHVNTTLMGDENDYALAMNSVLPFAFFLFLRTTGIKKFAALVILVLFVLAVVASMSRGGWLGLVAALGYCIIRSKKVVMSLGVALILMVAAGLFAPDKYWDEISSISDTKESTAQTRLDYWKAAVEMYKAYPITGVGAGNGSFRMPEFYGGNRDRATQWGRTFHGTLPQVIAELGTVGLICYLTMMIWAFVYLNRIFKHCAHNRASPAFIWADSILGGMIGYLVSATFLSSTYYPQLWTLYAFTVILLRLTLRETPIIAYNEGASAPPRPLTV